MTETTFGRLILDGDRVERDAIHIAAVPVFAAEKLYPGQHVGADTEGKASVSGRVTPLIGIVDPFLSEAAVYPDQRFWLFMYPNTITSLKHNWTHPILDGLEKNRQVKAETDEFEESEEWLKSFCDAKGPGWAAVKRLLVAEKGEWVENTDPYYSARIEDDCMFFGGTDAHGEIPTEFWMHVERVLGPSAVPSRRPNWFSCSC